MLNLFQNWLIYPDDVEKLRKTFVDAGFTVYKDTTGFWCVTKEKKKKKSFGLKDISIVKDGPFRGVRVERVAIFDAVEVAKALEDGNWGVAITKQNTKTDFVCLFIYDKSKGDLYERRLRR